MRLPDLGRWLRRSQPPAAPRQAATSVAERERRLAERLLEDEALRGELDDAAWQPIQDWLLARAARLAASTAALDDEAAQPILDAALAALRQLGAGLAEVLASRPLGQDLPDRLEPLLAAVSSPLVPPDQVSGARSRVRAVARELAATRPAPAEAAARLVAALQADDPPAGSHL